MLRVKECRKFAEQCRAMSKSARDETQRALFLQLADQWDSFVESRRKFLRLKDKIQKSLKD
jgi:hypothetical protein